MGEVWQQRSCLARKAWRWAHGSTLAENLPGMKMPKPALWLRQAMTRYAVSYSIFRDTTSGLRPTPADVSPTTIRANGPVGRSNSCD